MEEGNDALLQGPVAELSDAGPSFLTSQHVAHDAEQEQSSTRHVE